MKHPRIANERDNPTSDPRRKLFRYIYPLWTSLAISRRLKERRVRLIDEFLDGALSRAGTVMEVGCSYGGDFLRFLAGRDIKLYGMDINRYDIAQDNVTFVHGDAEHIYFPDGHFDVLVSIGVLEHIEPIEKLCRVIKEMRRVSKAYCMIVPSMGTILEPHTMRFLWQIRDRNKKYAIGCLNFYSDEAWTNFEGFREAHTRRFWSIPGLYLFTPSPPTRDPR